MTRREQAVQLIEGDIRRVYTEYCPVHHIVEQTNSLKFTALVQTGMTIYESRDCTHFILPTDKICDLLRPPQYQHVVARYDLGNANFGKDYYGTEIECRAWITRQQGRLYNFDPQQYHLLRAQLIQYEERLKALYKDAEQNDTEVLEINNYLQLVMREIRISSGIPEDRDLPQVSLEEAAALAEGTRA